MKETNDDRTAACAFIVPATGAQDFPLADRNWLVTNGLGGYASGTLADIDTWRYHGLLISAEAAPLGRTMLLRRLAEEVRLADGRDNHADRA